MKKIFLFVIVLTLLLDSFAYARDASSTGFVDYFTSGENKVFSRVARDGMINNKAPITTGNYPSNGQVVSGRFIEFSWNYFDNEGDSQISYQLELDDDPRFISSFTYYGLSETKRKIYILEGNKNYYWRVKSRDNLGWGELSEVENFYLDLTRKVCEDGTDYFQCSVNNFRYCDNGELVDNCQLCGCPLNSECTLSGVCAEKTCFDGTKYGSCGVKKPNFCQNGNLREVCSLCGCPEDKECGADGSCSSIVIKESFNEIVNIKENSIMGRFFSFLRLIFNR